LLNAADVTWSAVDFDRETIKVILIYSDDGAGPRVGRIIHGPDLLLKDGFWLAR
jgi:hypothetical protein